MTLLNETLALEIQASSSDEAYNLPSVFMSDSGTGYASFVVRAAHRPSTSELAVRLAATSSDLNLLYYDESRREGRFAVIDFDPPVAGEILQLVPALMPQPIKIIYEKRPVIPAGQQPAATRKQKKSR